MTSGQPPPHQKADGRRVQVLICRICLFVINYENASVDVSWWKDTGCLESRAYFIAGGLVGSKTR